jgi:AAA domain
MPSSKSPRIQDAVGKAGYAELVEEIAWQTSESDPSYCVVLGDHENFKEFHASVAEAGGNYERLLRFSDHQRKGRAYTTEEIEKHNACPTLRMTNGAGEVDEIPIPPLKLGDRRPDYTVPRSLGNQADAEVLIHDINVHNRRLSNIAEEKNKEGEQIENLPIRTVVQLWPSEDDEKYLDLLLARTKVEYYATHVNFPDLETGKYDPEGLIPRQPPNSTPLFHSYEQMKNAPLADFIIQDFLQAQAATLIAALASHGKTWLLIEMARALLTGDLFCGHFKVLKPATRVIYLIPEITVGAAYARFNKFGLDEFLKSGQLLLSTLSIGKRITLRDPQLLERCKDADIILDTLPRFRESDANESEATGNQKLAEQIFDLQAAGARSVTAAQHSPKAFEKETFMTLENVVRGSGDIGAMVATAWGLRRVTAPDDQTRCLVYVQNVKPRDFVPPEPFLLCLRPDIDKDGKIGMEKEPGKCGSMEEEKNVVGGPDKKAWAKAEWVREPKMGRGKLNDLIKKKFGSGVNSTVCEAWLREWKGKDQMEFGKDEGDEDEN